MAWTIKNRSAFTLIEILMAVLLIAILATIALTQFTNFARDTRNAAVRENLGILRNAVQKHFGTMRLRCGVTTNVFPALASVNANNIADGSSVCNTTQVGDPNDYLFVAAGIPENPWSAAACTPAERREVIAAGAATMTVGTAVLNAALGSTAGGTANCGWLYKATTGEIKANSNNNGGDSSGLTESAY